METTNETHTHTYTYLEGFSQKQTLNEPLLKLSEQNWNKTHTLNKTMDFMISILVP